LSVCYFRDGEAFVSPFFYLYKKKKYKDFSKKVWKSQEFVVYWYCNQKRVIMKLQTRKAYRAAINDMTPEFKELRKKLNVYWNLIRFDLGYGRDIYVVDEKYLNTKEQRYLNDLLGLNTDEGIAQWYSKVESN